MAQKLRDSRNKLGFAKLEVVTPQSNGVRNSERVWTDEFGNGDRPYQPPLTTPGTHEKQRKREAATVVQRWYRKQVLKYSTVNIAPIASLLHKQTLT